MSASDGKEWLAYYERFPYFSTDTVRDGCHPRVFEHEAATGKAIVLCHGLTDSPHFLAAIARHFHTHLGYDVYLPLLHGHGLKEPKGMEGVELGEWKANVRFAVQAAAEKAARVSIGGLSTGGALSFYMACTKPTDYRRSLPFLRRAGSGRRSPGIDRRDLKNGCWAPLLSTLSTATNP